MDYDPADVSDEDMEYLLGVAYQAWEDGAEAVALHPALLIYLMTGDLPPPKLDPHGPIQA